MSDLLVAAPLDLDPVKTKAIDLLNGLKEGLVAVQGGIDYAHPIVCRFAVIIGKIEQYISDALSFLDFIDDILSILHEGLKMCQYLGELIPEVGPILAEAASTIENLRIEQTVGQVVKEIKRVIKIVCHHHPRMTR